MSAHGDANLRSAPLPAAAAVFLRARIAALLRDPEVARRVGRRLAEAAPAPQDDLAGTPPCLRAPGRGTPGLVRVTCGRCHGLCRSVDCLCGRYPRSLSEREIADGRRLEAIAV